MVRMPNVQASFVIFISSPCFADAAPCDCLVKVFDALALAVFDIPADVACLVQKMQFINVNDCW